MLAWSRKCHLSSDIVDPRILYVNAIFRKYIADLRQQIISLSMHDLSGSAVPFDTNSQARLSPRGGTVYHGVSVNSGAAGLSLIVSLEHCHSRQQDTKTPRGPRGERGFPFLLCMLYDD